MGIVGATCRVCGKQYSLHHYRFHTILLEYGLLPDYSGVDAEWWEVVKFIKRGNEGDVGTNEDTSV